MSDLFAQTIAGAALLVALIGTVGSIALSISIKQEKKARTKQVDTFLQRQCSRDEFRDGIIVQALRDAQGRAAASIGDPLVKHAAILKLQIQINKLETLHNKCISQLPNGSKP